MQDEEKNQNDVNLSKRATAFVLIGLIVVLIIVIVSFRSCSITKKSENPNVVEVGNSADSDISNVASNTMENGVEITENSSKNSTPNTGWSDSSTVVENQSESVDMDSKSNNSSIILDTVSSDSIENGSVESCNAIVGKKNIYRNDSCYVYAVELYMIINDVDKRYITYFCSEKTYEILSVGVSVNVEYKLDKNNCVSIVSVSM